MTSPASIVGNLVRDPELRFTTSQVPVVNITVAVNRIHPKTKKSLASFFDVTVWGEQAEHTHASLRKGDRVLVIGHWESQIWESRLGEKHSKNMIVAEDIGPSLRAIELSVEEIDTDAVLQA